jgi:hypothetical protein
MFETELSTFYKYAQQLRKDNPAGGFVIIQGDYIFPEIFSSHSDAMRNGNRILGNDCFLIREINEGESSSVFEEVWSAINSHKEEIPSLIGGGFTNTMDSSPISSAIEIRKFCLEKAIEIFNMKKNFFFKREEGPLEYAEVLYSYITTGTITDFQLPGMRKKNK